VSQSRRLRIRRILDRECPYRVTDGAIRRLLNVLPQPRRRFRAAQDRFIAALAALPYRIMP
jgi:hypothetical protein